LCLISSSHSRIYDPSCLSLRVPKIQSTQSTESCQRRFRRIPRMLAFAGVFDGHDGDAASQYCVDGLLQHMLQSTFLHYLHLLSSSQRSLASSDGGGDSLLLAEATTLLPHEDPVLLPLAQAMQHAYEQAESEFASDERPPTFAQVGTRMTRRRSSRLLKRVLYTTPPKAGGTTACTLSVVRWNGQIMCIYISCMCVCYCALK
jgi:hypothetical protein